jgi:cytochrome P450
MWRDGTLREAVTLLRSPLRALDALARSGDTDLEVSVPGCRLKVVTTPESARDVLVRHDAAYRKGPGLAEARFFLGDGLLTRSGARWRHDHHRLRPLFDRAAIEAYHPVIESETSRAISTWQRAGGYHADVALLMHELTLSIAGRCFLGIDISAQAARWRAGFAGASASASRTMRRPLRLPRAVPAPTTIRERVADARLRPLVRSLPPMDVGAGDASSHATTLLFAGSETTAAALTWSCDALTRRRGLQEQLRASVRDLGSEPTVDAARRCGPLVRFVEEVLRMFPPVWAIPRTAREPHTIGGMPVEPGTDVLVAVYAMQRSALSWDEPLELRPERFGDDRARHPHPGYMPFGLGPRRCLGGEFALCEITFVLAALLAAAEIAPATAPDPGMRATLTLSPGRPIPIRLVPLR